MKKILFISMLFNYLVADIHIYQNELILSKPIKSWIEFRNENLTRQNYDYSCGSASLSTILKYYYDLNIGEKDILNSILGAKGLNKKDKRKLEESDMMLSFFDLANYTQGIGFKVIGLALDLESLSKLQAPVILFVKIRKDEHFTVYKNMDQNYVYLADPSFGNIKVRISKFKEMFFQREDLKHPGKVLAIIPMSDKQKSRIKHNFMATQKSSNSIYENIKDGLTKVK